MSSNNLILIALLALSCISPDKNLYQFDPRKLKENEITLTGIADKISYIPLENKIPIGLIYDNIEFINNSIYLSSKDIGILKFDNEGKFQKKFGSVGRGPGEYVYNFLFTVDKNTGSVYNFDFGGTINVYSRTGAFSRSFSLKKYGSVANMKFFNSNLFVLFSSQFNDSDYEWIVFDTLGNVVNKRERLLPKFNTNWGNSKPLYMFNNKLGYFNYFTDTVFCVSSNFNESPLLIISPGEHRRPRTNLSLEQMTSGKYLSLAKIIETNRFFILEYGYGSGYIALIDKTTHTSFLINVKSENRDILTGIKNDIDGGQSFFPTNYFTENGREYLLGIVYPHQIKAVVSSNEFNHFVPKDPKNSEQLKNLANSLKETDNPILMMVRLKK